MKVNVHLLCESVLFVFNAVQATYEQFLATFFEYGVKPLKSVLHREFGSSSKLNGPMPAVCHEPIVRRRKPKQLKGIRTTPTSDSTVQVQKEQVNINTSPPVDLTGVVTPPTRLGQAAPTDTTDAASSHNVPERQAVTEGEKSAQALPETGTLQPIVIVSDDEDGGNLADTESPSGSAPSSDSSATNHTTPRVEPKRKASQMLSKTSKGHGDSPDHLEDGDNGLRAKREKLDENCGSREDSNNETSIAETVRRTTRASRLRNRNRSLTKELAQVPEDEQLSWAMAESLKKSEADRAREVGFVLGLAKVRRFLCHSLAWCCNCQAINEQTTASSNNAGHASGAKGTRSDTVASNDINNKKGPDTPPLHRIVKETTKETTACIEIDLTGASEETDSSSFVCCSIWCAQSQV
mgnify:FL=1